MCQPYKPQSLMEPLALMLFSWAFLPVVTIVARQELCAAANAACLENEDNDVSLLQFDKNKRRSPPRLALGHLLDYYAMPSSVPMTDPGQPVHLLRDSEILEKHGHVHPLPAETMSLLLRGVAFPGSLLQVANITLLPGLVQHSPGLRFIAHGIVDESMCSRLRTMFDRNGANMQTRQNDFTNYDHSHAGNASAVDFKGATLDQFVRDPDFPVLLALRQHLEESVVKYFGNPKIQADFTHMIRRYGHPGNPGMGTHADNCQFHSDRICHKTEQCCAWRSHTAFLYLGGGVDGGDFYFAKGLDAGEHQNEPDFKVKPECGTMVGFSSGGENLHGVDPLSSGMRYSLGSWYSIDPNHEEVVP
jgi:hypothetical protein